MIFDGKCMTNYQDDPSTFRVCIDAISWETEDDAFESLGEAFKYDKVDKDWKKFWNWNYFADWIRELDWIKEPKVDFYPYNYKNNLSVDFIDIMISDILPYWQGSKQKEFNFYYQLKKKNNKRKKK